MGGVRAFILGRPIIGKEKSTSIGGPYPKILLGGGDKLWASLKKIFKKNLKILQNN